MNKKTVFAIVGTGIALVALSAGVSYLSTKNYYQSLITSIHSLRETDTKYPLISPLLTVVFPKDIAGSQLKPLLNNVRAIAEAEPPGTLKRYAFYFRDLTSNYWTGINENDQYDPASMLKVVAAIAAYRQNEDHPGFINSQPVYTSEIAKANSQFPFAPKVVLSVGSSYSIPYLIETMLSDSDNASKDLLLSQISPGELDDIFSDLSVPVPSAADSSGYTISALEYSRFFRVLYNGTYLNRNDSSEVLMYLSKSGFREGLLAGMTASTTVAHKFGEHINAQNNIATSIELHDCGIVYYPTRPYFICVMTEGQDEKALASFIADVARAVYASVNSDYK